MRYFPYIVIAYLMFQVQSLIVLWSMQFTMPALKDLETLQMYGYAAVGLGVAVLVLRSQIKLFPQSNALGYVCGVTMGAVAFMAVIVLLHMAVQQIPSFVPAEKRVEAYKSSLRLLADPSPQSFWSFYRFPVEEPNYTQLINQLVNDLQFSDEEIHRLYYNQLVALRRFSTFYNNNTNELNEDKFKYMLSGFRLRKKSQHAAKSAEVVVPGSLLEVLFINHGLIVSPLASRAFFQNGVRESMQTHSGILSMLSPVIPFHHDGFSYIFNVLWTTPEISYQQLAWDKLRVKYPFLSKSPFKSDDWTTSIRRDFSSHILGAEGLDASYFIPFHKQGIAPLQQQEFFFLAERIAPLWLVGTPTHTRNQVVQALGDYENKKAQKFLREFPHKKFEPNYTQFKHSQSVTMHWLLDSTNLWRFKEYRKGYGDFIRLSITLPVLLVLSVLFIVINLVLLAYHSGFKWCAIAVISGATSSLLAFTPISTGLFSFFAWLSTNIVFPV